MRELSSLKKVKTYEMVASELKEYIIENQLKPGDQLPTEIELARMLNVGRSSVREGIKYLQTLGIVEPNNNKGLVIKEVNLQPIKDILKFHAKNNSIDRRKLYEAANVIYLGVLPVIIEKITEEHICTLKQIIYLHEKAGSFNECIEYDYKFHVTLLEIAENEVISQLVDILKAFFKNKSEKAISTKLTQDTIQMHKEILRSLEEKDLGKAIEATLRHNDHLKAFNIMY